MARFISIPGVRPVQSDVGPGFRGSLPDIHGNPQFSEWLASRKPTSHTATGIDGFNRLRGEVAYVEGEEINHHTGEIEQSVIRNDATGSGTYRVTWEPNGDRGMVVKEAKRVHE